ncbi:MAG: hypothetical protein LJE69_07780 [Thiohalocapsa sp.]|uniref:hypothetical protein n=1 Tax=Thiohalocapsa sp. TaxID=2497641 RepID=UPI0025E8FD97|nr:hypothetical protein [Thiohalocapsa sp.]MCG6941134.1 hypothetical protein [Thiohalocapsa sp.]
MPTALNPSQSRPRERRDQLLFFAAFVIGALGTLTVKALSAPTWIVILFPMLVIGTYAAAAWLPGNTSLEPDMIGDNCYYLGFILTLVSLGWTLSAVTQASGDLDLVREIISGFGVALASTITGIFLRALFLQLRPDVVAAERQARQAISAAARDLRTELGQSVTALQDFARQTEQALAEHHTRLEAASAEAQHTYRQWMQRYSQDTAKEASVLYKAALAQVRVDAQATGAAVVHDLKSTLRAAQQDFQDWLRQADQRVAALCDQIDAQAQRLASSVAAVGESTKKASDQVEGAASALAKNVSGASERFAAETQGITNGLSGHAAKLGAAATTVQQALERESKGFADQLANASKRIRSAADESARTLAQDTRAAADAITASATEVSGALKAALEQLLASGGAIRSGSEDLLRIAEHIPQIAGLLDESEARLQSLRRLPTREDADASSAALAKSIAAIDKRIERFETAVVNATVLTKRVGEFSQQAESAAGELKEAGASLRAAAKALESTVKAKRADLATERKPLPDAGDANDPERIPTEPTRRRPFGMTGLFRWRGKNQG